MASKPMLALLKSTLQACYTEGTRAHESGLKVSTEKRPGETILFFKIDSSEGRKYLNMRGEGLKVCDYLVFYAKDAENREVTCFLELKGRKLEEAVEQVISTFHHVKALTLEKIDKEWHPHLVWKACICLHGQSPRPGNRVKELLKKEFGGNVRIKYGIKHDKEEFGLFLRE